MPPQKPQLPEENVRETTMAEEVREVQDRSRPSAEDSGSDRSDLSRDSADQGEDRSGVTRVEASDDGVDPKLVQRVRDTEAWVQRLRDARSEGTRLSQGGKGRVSQEQPRETQPRSEARTRDDVDEIVEALSKGDRAFVEALVNGAQRRIESRADERRVDMALADRITSIVNDEAPDVPMPLFWSFTDEAIAAAPGDTARQIGIAIELSRQALGERDKRIRQRQDANRKNREEGETLDRGGRGPRRGEEEDSDRTTMVDDIRRMQRAQR